jgi:glycosyltransferase involved in cell wall biosynthesis
MADGIRVLYVLNDAAGGATEGIVQLLRGLPERGIEAVIVVPADPEPARAAQLRGLAADLVVVPMAWWNRKTSLPMWYRAAQAMRMDLRTGVHVKPVRALARLIRDHRIDVVHTSTSLVADGFLAARTTRTPHVWHIKERIGRDGLTSLPLPATLVGRIATGRDHDRLVGMSRFAAEPFLRDAPPARTGVIYDGVEPADFDGAGRSEVRRSLGIADDAILVGMVASLRSPSKRHDLFVDMAERLQERAPNARFVIFGSLPKRTGNPIHDRPWVAYQRLLERVRSTGLDDRLTIGAPVVEIPATMAAIDILVHTSEIEGFGRVAIEAMAAGKPVVGPRGGGIAESVADGDTGILVPPRQVEGFVEAVGKLVDDPQERERLGESGRRRVHDRFSLRGHADAFASLYREMTG